MIRLLDLLHACRFHLTVLYAVIALSLAKASRIPMNTDLFLVVASFCSALTFAYLFNRITDRNEDARVCVHETVDQKNIFLFQALAVVAAFLGGAMLFSTGFSLRPYAAYLVISIFYSMRIGGFQIRKVLFFKNLYAAGAWFGSFGVILRYFRPSLTALGFTRACLYILFMVLAYELLWDIRDTEADKQAGIGTIPAIWGVAAGRAAVSLVVLTAFILSRSFLLSLTGLNLALLAAFALFTPTQKPRLFHVPLYAQVGFSLLTLLRK